MNEPVLEVVTNGGRDYADVVFCALGPAGVAIYGALHRPAGERVALTVAAPAPVGAVGPGGRDRGSRTERMLAEARRLRQAAGAHVVRIFGIVDVRLRGELTKAVVREWLPITFEDLVRKNPEGMAAADLTRYLAAAAKGLAELHRAGVAVRDLRAEHLLLGERDDLKVGHVAAGDALGAAPGHAFFARDIAALGAVFYRAAVGTACWDGLDHSAPLPPLDTLRPDLPQPLAAAIAAALGTEPDERVDSAGALLETLGVTDTDLPGPLTPDADGTGVPDGTGPSGAAARDAEQEQRAAALRRLSILEEHVDLVLGASHLLGAGRVAELRRRLDAARRWAAQNGAYPALVTLVSELAREVESAETVLRRSLDEVYRHVAGRADELARRVERLGPLGPSAEIQIWRRLIGSVPDDPAAATSLALLEVLLGLTNAIREADRLLPSVAAAAAERARAALAALDAARVRPGSPAANAGTELARALRDGADPAALAAATEGLARTLEQRRKRRRAARALALAAAVAVVLAAVAGAYWLPRQAARRAITPESTPVVIDAVPWGRVRSLVDARTGAAVPGSGGTITPAHFNLAGGSYEVVLDNEQFPQPLTLRFEVRPGIETQVRGTFRGLAEGPGPAPPTADVK